MKKRIIHVIDTLEQGGAQQYLLDLLDELKDDFEFLVLSFEGGPVAKKIKKLDVKVEILDIAPADIGFRYPFNIKKVLKWLRGKYNNFKPDIIQTHLLGADIWARLISPKNVKLIQTVHAADSFRGKFFNRKGLKNMFFDRYLIKKTNLIIVVSHAAQKSILDEGISKEKIKLIYSGINRNKFLPKNFMREKMRLAWHLSKKDLAIISIGRLDPIKGFDILLKAFKIICKHYKNIKLYLIGGGTEEANLKKLIKKMNLKGKVFLLGERQDVDKLLNGADVFILPSREEGRALVLLEAAANKKAIVASNVGGIPEFIKDRANGLLFRSLDCQDLATKIEILIRDKKLRVKLAEQAFLDSKKYDAYSMAKTYKQIYNSL